MIYTIDKTLTGYEVKPIEFEAVITGYRYKKLDRFIRSYEFIEKVSARKVRGKFTLKNTEQN